MRGAARNDTQTLNVTTPTDREIRIERIFDASRDRVWRAFTEPDLLAQWWGRGNRLEIERFELERGGHWRFVEHGPDGKRGFEGRYREVTPEERIVWTFDGDMRPGYVSVHTATFDDLGDGRTKVTTETLFLTREERDGMLQFGIEYGLKPTYAALDALLSSR